MPIPESFRRLMEAKAAAEAKKKEESAVVIAAYYAYIVTLHNSFLARQTQAATEFVVEYGPFQYVTYWSPEKQKLVQCTLPQSLGEDAPKGTVVNNLEGAVIADRYAKSLINKGLRYFDTPYYGDYFDTYSITTILLQEGEGEPKKMATPFLNWKRSQKVTILDKSGDIHGISVTALPPEGLSRLIWTGVDEELQFMLDLELAKKEKDSLPWLQPNYDPISLLPSPKAMSES